MANSLYSDLAPATSEPFIGQAPMPTPEEKLLIVGLRDARPLMIVQDVGLQTAFK